MLKEEIRYMKTISALTEIVRATQVTDQLKELESVRDYFK